MVQIGRAGAIRRSKFGDAALVVFLLAQAFDGVLTYVGVSTYGARMEGNPLLVWLMTTLGLGAAVTTAKTAAGMFGIALHLTAVHRVVAALAAFYVAVAVLPWIGILYYW